ncbi:LysR family transcriptional regulator [Halomonas sp. M1]|uniref:LysR family transcriptional regulator n=1 Tax=Halomonas sp. M1 TaxID=3035470 RepID=UPI00248523DD|nr:MULTISPECIES: LysR family transcriptional regulator [unclassified Halomonas]MDP3534378.1 LysR family transcriptional regulator [Halomonas sp.]WFE69968.1 LysR family transcriptional regulator [Halomonas sp. M1]
MLDFKELEAFVWAVRFGSFRKAAVRLHITQPSVSERISRLETTVGELLLERSARPIQPTMRGREFFLHAERMLEQRDEALKLFDSEEAFSAPLRLGTIETIVHSWFPVFMQRLTERYPKLMIELTVDYSPALNDRLMSNELDILLAMNGYLSPEHIEYDTLSPYEMGMFVAPRHAEMLSERPHAWCRTLPFISFGKLARPYEELVRYLADQGLKQPRIHSVSTLMTIVRLTIEGLGIGALPVATVLDEWRRGELYRIALPKPLPPMNYDVIWRSASHPRFCRSVGRLAQECATQYASARHAEMTTSHFTGLWVPPNASVFTPEATPPLI